MPSAFQKEMRRRSAIRRGIERCCQRAVNIVDDNRCDDCSRGKPLLVRWLLASGEIMAE